MNPVFPQLRESWRATCERVRPGLSLTDIASWENEKGVRLNDEVRAYYSVVDGMEPGDFGPEMIGFWPLQELESLGKDWDYHPVGLDDPDQYFVFADGSLDAFHYALFLPPVATDHSPVIQFSGDVFQFIAPSLTQFLTMYLENPESIVWPPEN